MIAHVNGADGAPEHVEDLVRVFREVGLPACPAVAGFWEAFLLVDRVTRQWMDVSLWVEEASLTEAFALADARIMDGEASLRQVVATTHEGVVGQTYEVAAEGWPRE